MNPTRTWIVAGATLAMAGFGTAVATASNDSAGIILNDPRSASVIQPVGDKADDRNTRPPDSSPESADSPAESPFDSADSGMDSPNDNSANSTDSAGSSGSADSPN